MKKIKPKLGVFYWHNPTRIGNLQLVNDLRGDFEIVLISNENIPSVYKYCDHVIIGSFGEPNGLISKLQSHKNRYGLDGLITLSEGAVSLMADAAEELKLRGNPADKSRIGRNKYLMRKKFHEAGIAQPSFYKVSSLEEALQVVRTKFQKKQFFLKPPCLGGSSYCSIINNDDQLRTVWNGFFFFFWERTKKDPFF